MDVPIVLYDSVNPFTDEDIDRLCDDLGENLEYETNFRDNPHLILIVVPHRICDREVIWGLQDFDHKNLVIRRDLMGELV